MHATNRYLSPLLPQQWGDIGKIMSSQLKEEKASQEMLPVILPGIQYLVRQDLALRGHEESNGINAVRNKHIYERVPALSSPLILLYTLWCRHAHNALNNAELLNGAVRSLYRHIIWHTTLSIQQKNQ